MRFVPQTFVLLLTIPSLQSFLPARQPQTRCKAKPAFVATCGEITDGGGAFADASCDATGAARVYDATKSTVTTPNDASCCKAKPAFVATCGEITDGGGAFADASCDATGAARVYDATKSATTTPNDANCCKASKPTTLIETVDTTFHDQLNASNITAALDTLKTLLAETKNTTQSSGGASGQTTATTVVTAAKTTAKLLLLVTNLEEVALLPDSTPTRRRQIADLASAAIFNIIAEEDGATRATYDNDAIFSSSTAIVSAVVEGTKEAGANLTTVTSRALLETVSSILRATSRPRQQIGAAFDRRTVVDTVEALAGATERSTVVARSISFTRRSIPVGNGADGNTGIMLSAYEKSGGASYDVRLETSDPNGLALPSRVRISSFAVNSEDNGDGNRGGDVYIFQYGQTTNPFSAAAASDVVTVRVDRNEVVAGVGASLNYRRLLSNNSSPTSSSPAGNLTIEMFPRNTNTTNTDECTAVFSVKAKGSRGLENMMSDACARWDGSSFLPTDGCRLSNVSMDEEEWSISCDCAVDQKDMNDGVTMSLIGYTFDR